MVHYFKNTSPLEIKNLLLGNSENIDKSMLKDFFTYFFKKNQ